MVEKIKDIKSYKKEFEGKEQNALQYALDIRKFEIELYWKRAAYFWVFIGLAFTGYFSKFPSGDKTILLIISCLGCVFSFAWVLVNKASKKWQENWEHHVDLLEDGQIGSLYKVVFPAKKENCYLRQLFIGANDYSVSKINQIISVYVLAIWVGLFIYSLALNVLLLFTEINISDILTISFVIISVVISVGTICLLCCWGRSKKYVEE